MRHIAILLSVLLTGCALGITTSDRPQLGAQVCVLSAEPIVLFQRRPKARAWGWAYDRILLDASINSAYVRPTGIG